METPPPTADIVAADPSSVKIAAIRAATTGLEFLDSLIALPTGRDSKSQGYTFNRFIKVMSREGKLPPEFNAQNYGSMKVGEKATLHASIKALTVDIHGKELFEKLRDSILMSYDIAPIAVAVAEVTEGVVVNRWALMAEFLVHPSALDALEAYHKKIPQEGKNLLLTDGMKNHRRAQIAELMRICEEEVAPQVSNLFGEKWPALLNIHPENGKFSDAEQFSALLTESKNAFDILKANLEKSGTQESGEVADSTALEFCKYYQRTCKLNHFYLWLCWKGKDLNFLSNSLSAGVATGGGEPAVPYSRSSTSSTTGSSVKLSHSDRKAAKGQHIEKIATTIGDVIKNSLQAINPTTPDNLSQKRAEAVLVREAETTLNLRLKRQREAIEADSFVTLSPWLQRKMRSSYSKTLSECNEY